MLKDRKEYKGNSQPKWDRNKIAIILRKYYHFQIHGKIVDKGEMWKKGRNLEKFYNIKLENCGIFGMNY